MEMCYLYKQGEEMTDFKEGITCETCGKDLFGMRNGIGKKIKLCDDCDYKRIHEKMVKDKQEVRDSLWGY